MFQSLPDHSPETLAKATDWELFDAARQAGWTVQGKPRRAVPPLLPGDIAKVYYVPSVSLERHRLYIIVLLRCERMFAEGLWRQVLHFQKQKYYREMLEGKSTGELPQHQAAEAQHARAEHAAAGLELDVQPPVARQVARDGHAPNVLLPRGGVRGAALGEEDSDEMASHHTSNESFVEEEQRVGSAAQSSRTHTRANKPTNPELVSHCFILSLWLA